MKRVFTLMVTVLSLCMVTNLSAQNLLKNGGFEEGNDPDESWRPLDWPHVQSGPNAIWIGMVDPDHLEETLPAEGNNCFRMQAHTEGEWGNIYQDVEGMLYATYTLSFKANFALGTKNNLNVIARIIPEDETQEWVYLVNDSISLDADTTTWENFSFQFDYDESGVAVRIEFLQMVDKFDIDSKVFIDEVSLVEGAVQGIEDNRLLTNVISPNPVADFIHFKNDVSDASQASIYSITGGLVKQVNMFGANSIDVSDLNSGIYFISVETNNEILTQKFVKQ